MQEDAAGRLDAAFRGAIRAIGAGLAQWQCSGFVNRRSGVRIPHPAPNLSISYVGNAKPLNCWLPIGNHAARFRPSGCPLHLHRLRERARPRFDGHPRLRLRRSDRASAIAGIGDRGQFPRSRTATPGGGPPRRGVMGPVAGWVPRYREKPPEQMINQRLRCMRPKSLTEVLRAGPYLSET